MKSLLLLHGALGSADQFKPLYELLKDDYKVHSLNFSGHGGMSFPDQGFSIPLFGLEVLDYMEQHRIEKASFFGYSMGGYVAMYLAKKLSGRVESVITLATKFHWDKEIAARESTMLDAAIIEQKLPAFAAQLKERHTPDNWKTLLDRTKELLEGLGKKNELTEKDYQTIETPVLLLLGDRDKMVTLEETLNVYKSLPNAQFGILPGTAHAFEGVDTGLLSSLIKYYL